MKKVESEFPCTHVKIFIKYKSSKNNLSSIYLSIKDSI